MTTNEVLNALNAKGPGQFVTIVLDRIELIGGKREGREVRKVSTYQVQAHVLYANRKPVQQAVEEGLRAAPVLPSWVDPVIVDGVRLWEHKTTKVQYLPLPMVGMSKKSEYFDPATGEPIDPATLKLPKKAPLKEGQVPFAACKLDNISTIR
jgi:hypothetical protein